MPAETHQLSDEADAEVVLDLLATIVGADSDAPGDISLRTLSVDDDLSILHLWASVLEELGVRSVDDVEIDDHRPATLRELATLFHGGLV